MPKHIDNVPSLSDFKAPWESDQGETEIDKGKLKKFIHNLLSDKAKALDSRDEAKETLTKAEADRDELQKQVDSKDPDSAGKIAKLEGKLKDAEANVAKAELNLARVEIAAEKGLTPKQAKRLQGNTRDELEADADELVEDLGIKKVEETDEEREEREEREAEEADAGRISPKSRVRLTNPLDAENDGSNGEVDYDAAAASIIAPRVI